MKASKTARQERAAERQAARAKRTDEAQLKRLDKINGKNKGAKKERARLTERIAKGINNHGPVTNPYSSGK